MKFRKKGMDYGTYKAMCAAKKEAPMSEDAFKALPVEEDGGDEGGHAEPDGDEGKGGPGDGDGDEGGGEGGDEGEEREEKSLGLGDLRKAMAAFDDVSTAASAAVGGSRETYLKARLDAGTITKSERAELGAIWAGTADNPHVDGSGRPLRKALAEYLTEEDRNVVNAAPLLKSLLGGVQDRLDSVQTRNEASNEALRQLVSAQGGLMKSMAGALVDMGQLLHRSDVVIKALEARLALVEKSPAPKRAVSQTAGAGQPRQLNKSTTGGKAAGEGGVAGTDLSKAMVVRGIHTLVKAAGDGGDFGTAARLTEECAAFERGARLSPGTLAAVQAVVS